MEIQILENTPRSVKLYIKGIKLHVLNSIRRVMISDVPTMAIDYVIFMENSSVFYDEYLAHRLGLIPLKSDIALEKYKPPEECAEAGEKGVFSEDCFAKFDLEAEGPESGKLVVYSKDLIPSDPSVVPVYDNIPIAELVKGQRIKLEAYARLGRGREHIKWSPVSVATHKFIPIITIHSERCLGNACLKCVNACPRNVFIVVNNNVIVDETSKLKCNFCKLCEEICPNNAIRVSYKENEFILNIELVNSLSAKNVLITAISILNKKIEEFKAMLIKHGVLNE
ncbi:MAG: DNA-directed RNA polymerase subunit D [Desulfurococcaceae archaeon]